MADQWKPTPEQLVKAAAIGAAQTRQGRLWMHPEMANWMRRMHDLVCRRGADPRRLPKTPADLLLFLRIDSDRIKGPPLDVIENELMRWADAQPKGRAAMIEPASPPPDLAEGYLFPPQPLKELARRAGVSPQKIKILLGKYDLRNYPAGNRQSWTVCLRQPMPTPLRTRLERED